MAANRRSASGGSSYLQVFTPPWLRQLPEQQSALVKHDWPTAAHCGHTVVPAQVASAQSIAPSQSSSTPFVHELSVVGGAPQSPLHVQRDSNELQTPSPQTGAGPQSSAQT